MLSNIGLFPFLLLKFNSVILLQMEEISKNKGINTQRPNLALWLSIGCAIHCLSWPVILVLMPLAASQIPFFHEVEYVLIGLSAIFSAWVLFPAYKRNKKPLPGILAILGFIILVVPHLVHLPEIWAFPGAMLMAIAQLLHLKSPAHPTNPKAHIIDIAPAKKLGRKAS